MTDDDAVYTHYLLFLEKNEWTKTRMKPRLNSQITQQTTAQDDDG